MSDVLPPPGVSFDRAGRDACRSPMQWADEPGGGFTTGTPWLPLGDTHRINVSDQRADSASLLSLYRRLIAERHGSRALAEGAQRSLDTPPESGVFGYLREAEGDRRLVVLECAGAGSPSTPGPRRAERSRRRAGFARPPIRTGRWAADLPWTGWSWRPTRPLSSSCSPLPRVGVAGDPDRRDENAARERGPASGE